MPAGTALTPGGLPVRLPFLLRLPEDEVHRIFLLVLAGDEERAEAALQVVQVLMGKLAVVAEALRPEVNCAILRDVGVSLVDQLLDHLDHSVDLFGCLGMRRRGTHVQGRHVLLALGDVPLCDRLAADALFLRRLDDLVVDVREVGDVIDAVSLVLKVAADRIEHDHGSRIADVDQIVYGRSADVHLHLARCQGNEFLFSFGHGVVDLHSALYSFVCDLVYPDQFIAQPARMQAVSGP